MAMKRFMVQADGDLIDRARRRARERGVSLAQLVRDALEREVGNGRQPPLSIIGKFASPGQPDAKADTESGSAPPVASPFSEEPVP